jgi:uncharacterized protein involved in response to NO
MQCTSIPTTSRPIRANLMMSNKVNTFSKAYLGDWPLFALGFRPFYLGAAVFALLAMPVWLALYAGLPMPTQAMSGLTWHMHEMIFGFAPAVIAGFLLTAVRNWTDRPTPTGWALASLFLLWVSGRILMLTGPLPVAAAVDLMFLPAVGVAVAIPIWQSRSQRNFKVLVIILALTIANLAFHLANLQVIPYALLKPSYELALNIITILIAIMGGRVIPVFMTNAIPTASVRSDSRIEIVAIGSLVTIAAMGLISPWWTMPKGIWIVVLAASALSHSIRLSLWAPHRAISQPLLLMLPVAYAWLPLSLALRLLAELALVPAAAAVHALTIGAMSSLMLAMMTRSALGHTGRPLLAGPAEIGAFTLLQLSAIVRVFAGSIPAELYRIAVLTAGTMWTVAFGVFLIAYWPILTRRRIDGRPG